MLRLLLILVQLAADAVRWCGLALRSQRSIEAENLFLRRQLALYVERGVGRWRIDSVTRVALAFLSRFFHWRDALVVVRPESIACDFFLAVTVTFRQLYVFVVIWAPAGAH